LGGTNPQVRGWRVSGGITGGPAGPCNDTGVPARGGRPPGGTSKSENFQSVQKRGELEKGPDRQFIWVIRKNIEPTLLW